MYTFSLKAEQRLDAKKHMERVLGTTGEGDVTIACWEPGQTSPYHCHPDATEIYFCFERAAARCVPQQKRLHSNPEALSSTHAASCTSTSTARSAPFSSGYATAARSRDAPRNGRATRTGSRAPKTSSSSDRILAHALSAIASYTRLVPGPRDRPHYGFDRDGRHPVASHTELVGGTR